MKYKTSDLAKLAGISSRTLRYYDQINLLKPKRGADSNYRFYDSDDIDSLQQILFFKEMGFELKKIKKLMSTMNHEERIKVLNNHLLELNEKQIKLEKLVSNVKDTILHLKGEIVMSDDKKFEGLKDELIKKNEEQFKDEVIANWGSEAYEKSRKQFKNMTKEQFKQFNDLSAKIIECLQKMKDDLDDEYLEIEVAKLHKEWISMAWCSYDRDMHLNIADMYVQDERFKAYYDAFGVGLAQILRDAIHKHI